MSKETVEEKEIEPSYETKNETDPNRSFLKEKLKISAAKGLMTKRVKRLKTALEEFKYLDNPDIPSKSLHGVASEVDESKSAVNEAYTKMETINEVLVKKLILLDRSGGVPKAKKTLEELNNALEEY